MATSMERNSEKHVTKTRTLTPKQQVTALYPHTICFYTGKHWEIWAEDDDKLFRWGSPNFNGHTSRQAWAYAWESIQKIMIKKLES